MLHAFHVELNSTLVPAYGRSLTLNFGRSEYDASTYSIGADIALGDDKLSERALKLGSISQLHVSVQSYPLPSCSPKAASLQFLIEMIVQAGLGFFRATSHPPASL